MLKIGTCYVCFKLMMSDQILNVTNFLDLVSTPYRGEMNAVCWSRNLKGDFSEIVNKVVSNENISTLTVEELRDLPLSKEGILARDVLVNDLQALQDYGASPMLNIIKSYDRDDAYPYFPTDVYSYHVDRSPVPTDTFLCTYFGASSELLPNTEVTQKILIPEIREELKKLYGGGEDGFEDFLTEFFFDLHYQPKPAARSMRLGIGHLWKLAVDCPQSPVLPCVHRAPEETDGQSRLLLIC